MTSKSIAAILSLTFVVVPAHAKHARTAKPLCADRYVQFSWRDFLLGTGPTPQANGCAPAIYQAGRFIGQDPDPNVRLQLLRNSVNEDYELNNR